MRGIESAHLTTDAGIDLVAYSPKGVRLVTIQVKANRQPKPSGGKGSDALDWWVPASSPADYVAFVDLSTQSVWLLSQAEVAELAQQQSRGRYHLYMYTNKEAKPAKSGRLALCHEFEPYLLQNRAVGVFGS
jgi:hypothetical protein